MGIILCVFRGQNRISKSRFDLILERPSHSQTQAKLYLATPRGSELSVTGGIQTERGQLWVRDVAQGECVAFMLPRVLLWLLPSWAGSRERACGPLSKNELLLPIISVMLRPTVTAVKKSHLYLFRSSLELGVQINFM